VSYARKHAAGGYRAGYLRSTAWFARRDRWFTDQARTGVVVCALCGRGGDASTLELHHLTYDGVTRRDDGTWWAHETHQDLIALHPAHHEWLHKLLDRDRALTRMSSRRAATFTAIRRLQASLQRSDHE
jgi:hypothetical protein